MNKVVMGGAERCGTFETLSEAQAEARRLSQDGISGSRSEGPSGDIATTPSSGTTWPARRTSPPATTNSANPHHRIPHFRNYGCTPACMRTQQRVP